MHLNDLGNGSFGGLIEVWADFRCHNEGAAALPTDQKLKPLLLLETTQLHASRFIGLRHVRVSYRQHKVCGFGSSLGITLLEMIDLTPLIAMQPERHESEYCMLNISTSSFDKELP